MRWHILKVIRINRFLVVVLALLIGVSLYTFNQAKIAPEEKVVEARSSSAANRVVVIDPGHGGIDPGAVGGAGTPEKEIVLSISKKLAQQLAQSGAIVLLTRENDRDLAGLNEGSLLDWDRYDIAERVDLANKRNADIFLGIHCNAITYTDCRGGQTFYYAPSKQSKRLAELIQNEMISQLKNTDREPHPADYYTLRQAEMPSVTIEVGFLSNADEEKLLKDGAYQSKIAGAIYSGVVKYFAEITPAGSGTPEVKPEAKPKAKPEAKPEPKPKRWWQNLLRRD